MTPPRDDSRFVGQPQTVPQEEPGPFAELPALTPDQVRAIFGFVAATEKKSLPEDEIKP